MLGPVSISFPTLVAELIIFLVMVGVMERFVFAPIRDAWAERDRSIQEGIAASARSKEEAEKARAEVDRILAEARQVAQTRIDEGIALGNRERDELVAQATDEFRRLLEAARRELAAERERSAADLRNRIVDIALMAASRVTGQSFNEPQVRELAAAVVTAEGLRYSHAGSRVLPLVGRTNRCRRDPGGTCVALAPRVYRGAHCRRTSGPGA